MFYLTILICLVIGKLAQASVGLNSIMNTAYFVVTVALVGPILSLLIDTMYSAWDILPYTVINFDLNLTYLLM